MDLGWIPHITSVYTGVFTPSSQVNMQLISHLTLCRTAIDPTPVTTGLLPQQLTDRKSKWAHPLSLLFSHEVMSDSLGPHGL